RNLNGELLSDADRLSFFGKLIRNYSLDEIPQLINVINGDMSLVGPRPLLEEYLELYSEDQLKRHLVKPGITGWAQINGRNGISWEKKFELDLWYTEHLTFFLDIKILFITLYNVVKGTGVSQKGHVTIGRFKGKTMV
ncbi:MAG: lipopolysaccharide/colanic/teichoic acid biosynthesis glycosyltransferase, partial [Algoriphagus sp.]